MSQCRLNIQCESLHTLNLCLHLDFRDPAHLYRFLLASVKVPIIDSLIIIYQMMVWKEFDNVKEVASSDNIFGHITQH